MSTPIKRGDLADIVEGALGVQGPNIGKRVTVGYLMGQHSLYGNIWQVSGENTHTNETTRNRECHYFMKPSLLRSLV